jgi:hypothetical protein
VDRAAVYAQVGERERALAEIERLLREPSRLSVALLRLDPSWAALRDDPRFERILATHSP